MCEKKKGKPIRSRLFVRWRPPRARRTSSRKDRENVITTRTKRLLTRRKTADTTSWILTVATYHLFQRPELSARLAEELRGAARDPRDLPAWSALEQLPLLSSVVSEALRLGYGLSGRSPRVATHEDLVYTGAWRGREVQHVVPRGWPVGMTTPLLHHDETVFPDSERFLPERWLDDEGRRRKELERFLFTVSFSPFFFFLVCPSVSSLL